MTDKGSRTTRREEYAEATRQAIIDAARKLFCDQGFFGTKVEDIASLARVSPATIYAVAGGKQGLLQTLMEMGTSGTSMCNALRKVQSAETPVEVISLTASVAREFEERAGDIMRVIVETAPHDEAAAKTHVAAIGRYREAMAVPAKRLVELGALRPGIDTDMAIDILWFYFDFTSSQRLVQQSGWPAARADAWLTEQAANALLAER